MSTDDLMMVSEVLLGITNVSKEIRTASMNKLQELRKNLGALTFCLLQISDSSNNNNNINNQNLQITALVICRKILDINDFNEWKNIDNELKNKIKQKSLELFLKFNETNLKSKICDVITQIVDKVSDNDEEWEDFKKLVDTIYNYDPNDNNNVVVIDFLLKLMTEATGFLFVNLQNNFDKLISYFNKIFSSSNIKLKVSASSFISELISFGEKEQLKSIKPLLITILKSILECFNSISEKKQYSNEENLKTFLKILIEMCSIEPDLFKPHFIDMFILCQKIIDFKSFEDEKIRELAFEVIINEIDEIPSLIKKNKSDLSGLFEMIYKFGLDFNEKNYPIEQWENPNTTVYETLECIEEESVQFARGLIDRLVESIGLEITLPVLSEIISKLIYNENWKFKYIGLFTFSSLTSYEEDMANVEKCFGLIFNLTKNENKKVRYAAINAINKLSTNYNPDFQKKYINDVLPLLINIFQTENVLRIQCEIIESITSFIQFTSSENLTNFVSQLYEMLFKYFIAEINIILRKCILDCILEINSTIEEKSEPFAKKAFEILYKYFEMCYKNKSNVVLYGTLIENLTTLGPYIQSDYFDKVPILVQCIIELVEGVNFDNSPIRSDLQNSIERLVPILQSNFMNLLPNLVNTVIKLIKIRPTMSVGTNENEFEMELFDNKENNKEKNGNEIKTSATEDFAGSISLLNTLIESLGSQIINIVPEIEKEILPLLTYSFDNKVRTKSAKILPNIIKILNNQNDKIIKGKLYIQSLINAIEKEKDDHVCEKFFIKLKDVIENSGEILNANEVNEFFNKIMTYFNNISTKRNNLIKNRDKEKKKNNNNNNNEIEEDSDILSNTELIEEDIESLENIQSEIADLVGILFKSHKNSSQEIVKIILEKLIPNFLSQNTNFEIKMAIYLIDDLIEFLGESYLSSQWDFFFRTLIIQVSKEDCEIRQSAAYGLGIFAQFTSDYSKYAEDSVKNLQKSLVFTPNDNTDEEEFGLAKDNIIASFGKIIKFQSKNEFVKNNFNDIFKLWSNGLLIKYDSTEMENQHEWYCDVFLENSGQIRDENLENYFNNLIKIYMSKYANEIINKKIEKIFDIIKQNEKYKNIIENIYNNSKKENKKNKIKKLINNNN